MREYTNRSESGTVMATGGRKSTQDMIVDRVMMIAERLVSLEKKVADLEKKVN